MRALAHVTLFVTTPLAWSGIIVSVDKLDASDGIPLPPAHLVIVDIGVDVPEDTVWEAAALVGNTSNGANFQYEYDLNSAPLVTAPGLENRFTTFLSLPAGRNEDARFLSERAPVIAGSYSGPPFAEFYPNHLDVVFFDNVLPPTYADGYVARIALDLSGVTDPRFQADSANIVVSTSRPADSVVLMEAIRSQNGVTVAYWGPGDNSEFLDWGVYGIIPEPVGLLLLVCGGAWLRWRVRRSALLA